MESTAASHPAGRRVAAISTHTDSPARLRPARRSFHLADVVTMPETSTVRAMDAPTVMGGGRLYLPSCLAELDWEPGDELRLWVQAGHGLLTHGPHGAGKRRRLGTGRRLTVPTTSLEALGATVGSHVVTLVASDADHIVLFGPTALTHVAGLLAVPRHVRGLIDDLAGTDMAGVAALSRLAATLSSSELDALADVSVERLRELGLLGDSPPDTRPEPR